MIKILISLKSMFNRSGKLSSSVLRTFRFCFKKKWGNIYNSTFTTVLGWSKNIKRVQNLWKSLARNNFGLPIPIVNRNQTEHHVHMRIWLLWYVIDFKADFHVYRTLYPFKMIKSQNTRKCSNIDHMVWVNLGFWDIIKDARGREMIKTFTVMDCWQEQGHSL